MKKRIALLLGLALMVVPVAFAGNGSKVTVPMQYNTNNCGEVSGKKFDGTVTFSQKKGTLTVTVDIAGGDPTGSYWLYLYYDAPTPCSYWAYLGKIKIDASGRARKVIKVTDTSGYNNWIVYAENGDSGLYDTSQVAHLGA